MSKLNTLEVTENSIVENADGGIQIHGAEVSLVERTATSLQKL